MQKWSTFAHRTIRAAVLITFVIFIVQISRSDALIYYVAPRMALWVKSLAVGMYVLAMHQLYLAVRDIRSKEKTSSIACSCSAHSHDQWKPSVIIMYTVLIIPLILAFSFPNAVLGSQMAAKKGLNLTPSGILVNNNYGDAGPNLVPNDKLQLVTGPTFPFNEYTKPYAKRAADMYNQPLVLINDDFYIESLTSLDLYQDQFIGKKVQISGYVYRLDNMNKNQFALGRFSMRCCVADSVPLAILVETDNPEQWKNDMYVVALGTIEKRNLDGKDVVTIVAKTIDTQKEPTSPYVYQNAYFGS
ncbi:TIGR03943 family putative permease subunit [Paenibacillus aceris]|uniref:Repeat protein (TIGR03943 family) n=1 Tax=Paenibacillus aceris TaxID=869555 RepID=A0ABS4I7J7_9BACL|nr:TIGR03943 family protein [Paenibacillus aceris]MBP1966868.1 putative repeat protein (TIGR03943 family) [Paenibacillus aceris]NHW38939.1 TIGR03943 family protein [Paenibacillus aceris]